MKSLPCRSFIPDLIQVTFERLRIYKDLADTIKKPPHHWTEDNLWAAYAALEKSKVQI